MFEECIASVVKVLREGRKGGGKNFYIAGDINVDLGLMCTDENEEEELTKLCGPFCWQGYYDKDPGGSQKIWWYGIMKEFDCEVPSTWSACGTVRAEAFTHRHLGKDRKEELSQLDCIIGPMRRNDEVSIHNAGRLWATWDHYPIFARIEEEPHVNVFQKWIRKKVDGLEADNRRALITFEKGSHEKRERHGRRSLGPRKYYTVRMRRRKKK